MSGQEPSRLWQLMLAVVTVLLGLVGWFLQHELNTINTRLDRITTYVLQHHESDAP